jgi:hypothetical protein
MGKRLPVADPGGQGGFVGVKECPGRLPIFLLISNPLPPYIKQGGFVGVKECPGRLPIFLLISNPLPPYIKQGGFVGVLGKV